MDGWLPFRALSGGERAIDEVDERMQLIVTVDTEADNQWDVAAPQTLANLEAVPRFQHLCDAHDLPPTYLCTYEVVTSGAFAHTIGPAAEQGRAEVGAHLHPWSTPPFDTEWDAPGTARPYPSELPGDLLAGKLAALTAAVEAAAGRRPTGYRAGRWGFSAAQIPMLTALGYEVDCSVTPGMSWRRDLGLREGGPDFTSAQVEPYELAMDDACRPGDCGLLEVPVTILHTSALMRASGTLRRSYQRHRRSLPWRVANRLLQVAPQWLRPEPHMTTQRLITVAETARALGLPVLELMLHSSELLPGASPSNRTAEAVEQVFVRLSRLFTHLVSRGVTGATLTGFARAWRTKAT